MPRASSTPGAPPFPTLAESLSSLTVEELKWYAAALPVKLTTPIRKAELVELVKRALRDPAQIRQLWAALAARQQEALAEVVHNQGGVYDKEVIEARYPGVAAPAGPQTHYGSYYTFGTGRSRVREAGPYDLFFYNSVEIGFHVPPELLATLVRVAPKPQEWRMPVAAKAPTPVTGAEESSETGRVMVADTERAVFQDLAATLSLIQAGKIGVSTTTSLPTLPAVRQLRPRLLNGDYFGEDDYERAEDSMRPFALILLVQAAKWAAPGSEKGSKLELTKKGQAVLAGGVRAEHVREAWERWVKSDLLDELSRVRAIKGQQSKEVRLTKPASRREQLVMALQACPVGEWVNMEALLRYMRAEKLIPIIERNFPSALYVGSVEYGWLGYDGVRYWDVVAGSYLRATLWEYAATLGLVEIAYTRPEDSDHDFGNLYGLDEEPYLSRYDGLMSFRLTALGAYALGRADSYTQPAAPARSGPPLLRVLPNLDLVVTDATRLLPSERALLERIAETRGEAVYHLSREKLLDAAEEGVTIEQTLQSLSDMSGVAQDQLPQTVRVFFSDLEKRLNVVREAGRMVMLEGDLLVLTELAYTKQLRGIVQLGNVGERTVLLIPESEEAAVRRQIKKLGYVPRK